MIERLTVEDEFMLWPDEIWPQDIGALAVLDGQNLFDPAGLFRIDAVTAKVTSRLHLQPRLRQLLSVPPRRLGRPLWVDFASFDPREHIKTVSIPAPGDEAQLLAAVERIRRRRLDRSRPLWEMWFLLGLADGRVGLFVRMHHAMADGMAAMATISTFLDPLPDADVGDARPWTPTPPPTPAELFDDNVLQRARLIGRWLAAARHAGISVKRELAAWPALRELLAEKPLPATSLNRLVGPDRSLALVRTTLGQMKDAASSCDATVNDVVLSATAGGLRRLFRSRQEAVDGSVVRVYVPVSLHQGPNARARDNLIAQMVVPLPIDLTDPAGRLRRIAAETSARKARARPSLGVLPHRGIAGRAFLKLVARQKVNVITADIPGPAAPLYFAGARLLEVFPMVQLIGTVSLAVGAMSYAGQFTVMVVADKDAFPDLDIFAAGMQDELAELESRTEPKKKPGHQ